MFKIGYLGPAGTFSHEALKRYADGMADTERTVDDAVPFSSIPEILIAVRDKVVDEAVVPMENSIEGAVNATMDMIALEVDLFIKAEMIIPIREHLLARKGLKLSQVKHVLSHPQPLGQCRKFLSEKLPYAEAKPVCSTAAAAEEVAKSSEDYAAIGSSAAAETYGLDILQKDIQDHDNNLTRFVVIGRNYAERTGRDRTSIAFSTEDEPGSLYRVLDIFNLWGINLTRIESRPAKNKLGRYIFFVDIMGHREDEDIKDALIMVKKKTSFLKFLGSYPIFTEQN